MNIWDVRSAEKLRSKEGDRKSPDVVNWAADPFLCDAAVAAVPQRFCPEHIMVIAKVAIPSRDASGIESADRLSARLDGSRLADVQPTQCHIIIIMRASLNVRVGKDEKDMIAL